MSLFEKFLGLRSGWRERGSGLWSDKRGVREMHYHPEQRARLLG
jgi:hypothetical protein